MQLFEMQGLLAGKCLPGDMFVGESLSEYFLRQFNQRDELGRQVSALQLSHDNIINSLGIKGDGSVSKLIVEYVMGLVAENAALRDSVEHAAGCIAAAEAEGLVEALHETSDERLAGLVHRRLCHAHLEVKTPATDAAIDEVKAQGV